MITLLGGTFDPVHQGHLELAHKVKTHFQLPTIHFMPAFEPQLKTPPVATASQRLEMLKLAIQDYPYFDIELIEYQQKGATYTINTLRTLRKKHPQQPIALILGMDAFLKIDQWQGWQELLDCAHLILSDRQGKQIKMNSSIKKWFASHQSADSNQFKQQIHGSIYHLQDKIIETSSTQIRKAPRSIYLPRSVSAYIEAQKIYDNSTEIT